MYTPILLLADDEQDFLNTRAERLENAGYIVVRAANPAEAKTILEHQHIDLAIFDYKFGEDKTGLQLAQEIDHHIPVVILTAHFEAEIVRAALAADKDHRRLAVTCLEKRLPFEAFVAELETYLAHLRQSAQKVQARNAQAFLVGITSYKHANRLTYCVDDVDGVNRVLDMSYKKRVLVTTKAGILAPTRGEILAQLKEFTQLQPDMDLLLFVFSGHGGVEGEQSYLLARDSQWGALDETAIPVKSVLDKMRGSGAKAKVMLLDACHSGIDGAKGDPQASLFLDHINEHAKGVVVMASCSLHQKARESHQLRHGIFSYFLIEGLRGAADTYGSCEVTVSALHQYLTRNVVNYTSSLGASFMMPTLFTNMEGDIVLNHYHFSVGGAAQA